ncbi:MAG: energy-coupling factor transporter transmembrane protein EcfT [Micrococcales bacterium]|nr:energy-coupling factor transporter transmembrane protein EcfT [Micrococcales bacterium]
MTTGRATRGFGLFGSPVPGHSLVHRAPLWVKFGFVLLVGVSTFVVRDWRVSAAVCGVVLLVHLASGLGLRRLMRSLAPLLPILVVLTGFQWWSHDLPFAARLVLGILAAYVAAGILTATTPVDQLLDGIVWAARPARRWVDPETVALTISIMLRSIPWIAGAFGDVRESAKARGLERSPRAVILPAVIHTVAYARRTGDALAARGLGDPR